MLIQVSVDDPNINWELVDLFNEGAKDSDSSSPDRLSFESWCIYVFHGAYTIGQKFTI